MSIATDANVRTTQAADKEGLSVALRVAFTGGAVMGFVVSIYVCVFWYLDMCHVSYVFVLVSYVFEHMICHVSLVCSLSSPFFSLTSIGCRIRTIRCIPLLLPNDSQS